MKIGIYSIIFGVIMSSIVVNAQIDSKLLREKAYKAGLRPIPRDPDKLKQLIDPENRLTPQRVELGRMLYFDTRLSKDNTVSCASCHNLSTGGDDNIAVATGIKGQKNPHHLNSPTVYNAVFFKRQFWDGRVHTLEEQAQGPMQAPFEMGMTKELVEKRINSIPGYVKLFKDAYGNNVKIDFKLIADTIGLYERTLYTPSKFDDFMNGDLNALSEQAKRGLNIYIERGCTNCHFGVGLGGDMEPFGVVGTFKYMNVGDFKGDKNGLIKAPTHRNITETAPYFHNGTVAKLSDAIKEMSRIQLTLSKIKDSEVEDIIAFFKSLKGELPDNIYMPKKMPK